MGRKFRENPFWFKLAQGFELPGKNSLKLMYDRNPVIINFDFSSHKGLSNVECTLCICLYIVIMEMSGVKIRDTVGWKVTQNPFWFMLLQVFELPGVKIH